MTNTPDVLTEATADMTALLLAACRRVGEGERILRAGPAWRGWSPTELLGVPVAGGTLGIVGLGRIGRAVARRAAGFGMREALADARRRSALRGRAGRLRRRAHIHPRLLASPRAVLTPHAASADRPTRERMARCAPTPCSTCLRVASRVTASPDVILLPVSARGAGAGAQLSASGLPARFVSLGRIGHLLPPEVGSLLARELAWVPREG